MGGRLVSSPLDDLCIDIWNPDDKEIGYSNVLGVGQIPKVPNIPQRPLHPPTSLKVFMVVPS